MTVQDGKDGKVLGTLRYVKVTGAYSGSFKIENAPKTIKVVVNDGPRNSQGQVYPDANYEAV